MKKLIPLGVLLLLLTGCSRPIANDTANANDTSDTGGIVQRAYTMDQEVYDRAFTGNASVVPAENVVAGIIPHHLLASHQIARWFDGVKNLTPSVVVVVGPNHNEIGNGSTLTSQADWNTPYGILEKENEIIRELVESRMVNVDERIFTQEHSISTEVSFIKRTWPDAKFIPLILKSRVSEADQEALAAKLNETLPPDALVIASADFSHYLTSAEADKQDAVTLPALQSLDTSRVDEMFVDSKPTIQTVLEYAKLRGVHTFTVQENTNSAKVTGHMELTEVTSYFTAYYTR